MAISLDSIFYNVAWNNSWKNRLYLILMSNILWLNKIKWGGKKWKKDLLY